MGSPTWTQGECSSSLFSYCIVPVISVTQTDLVYSKVAAVYTGVRLFLLTLGFSDPHVLAAGVRSVKPVTLLSCSVQIEMQIEEFVEDESRVDKPKPQ